MSGKEYTSHTVSNRLRQRSNYIAKIQLRAFQDKVQFLALGSRIGSKPAKGHVWLFFWVLYTNILS